MSEVMFFGGLMFVVISGLAISLWEHFHDEITGKKYGKIARWLIDPDNESIRADLVSYVGVAFKKNRGILTMYDYNKLRTKVQDARDRNVKAKLQLMNIK